MIPVSIVILFSKGERNQIHASACSLILTGTDCIVLTMVLSFGMIAQLGSFPRNSGGTNFLNSIKYLTFHQITKWEIIIWKVKDLLSLGTQKFRNRPDQPVYRAKARNSSTSKAQMIPDTFPPQLFRITPFKCGKVLRCSNVVLDLTYAGEIFHLA